MRQRCERSGADITRQFQSGSDFAATETRAMGTSNSKNAPQATQPRHDDGLAPLTDATPLAEREARATMQLMAALHRDNAAKAAWFASNKLALYDDKDVPYCYKPLRLPLDDEGYVTTCAFDDPDAIREFYNTFVHTSTAVACENCLAQITHRATALLQVRCCCRERHLVEGRGCGVTYPAVGLHGTSAPTAEA